MNKRIIKTLVILLFIVELFACKKDVVVTVEEKYVPEPANQFAVDKETETLPVEETNERHKYPEDFIIKPEKEISIDTNQFLTKINYVRNNIDKFTDTVIKIEGMYGRYKSWDETFDYPMVYRNGPGCCANDVYDGFYLVNINQNEFELDDWIKVKGKPFLYDHTDSEGTVTKYLFLVVEEIKKGTLKERKAEMVNN